MSGGGMSEVLPFLEGAVIAPPGEDGVATVHQLGEGCWCGPQWRRPEIAGDDDPRVLVHFDRAERN